MIGLPAAPPRPIPVVAWTSLTYRSSMLSFFDNNDLTANERHDNHSGITCSRHRFRAADPGTRHFGCVPRVPDPECDVRFGTRRPHARRLDRPVRLEFAPERLRLPPGLRHDGWVTRQCSWNARVFTRALDTATLLVQLTLLVAVLWLLKAIVRSVRSAFRSAPERHTVTGHRRSPDHRRPLAEAVVEGYEPLFLVACRRRSNRALVLRATRSPATSSSRAGPLCSRRSLPSACRCGKT